MKPYRQHTPMRLRFVRRLRYGRGHGVHSPRAYALVQSLVRPKHTYYASVSGSLNALLYRMVARLRPSVCVVDGGPEVSIDVAHSAYPHIGILRYEQFDPTHGGSALLLTSDMQKAMDFTSGIAHERFVLLTGIRSSRSQYKAFRTLPDTLRHGTLIDLYDCALLYNSSNELYVYRSSL